MTNNNYCEEEWSCARLEEFLGVCLQEEGWQVKQDAPWLTKF